MVLSGFCQEILINDYFYFVIAVKRPSINKQFLLST